MFEAIDATLYGVDRYESSSFYRHSSFVVFAPHFCQFYQLKALEMIAYEEVDSDP